MIKTILSLIITILKNKNYITVAKQIWHMVDENFRISQTVEEKISSKVEYFNKALVARFPELTQEDVDNLRQAIAGEINKGKDPVISNSDLLKQVQEENTQLKSENVSLKNQLSQFQSLAAATNVNSNTDQQVTA